MSAVEAYRVTGDWRHLVDDGMVDPDDLPDEVRPTGYVRFVPLSPSVAITGTPATAYTLSVIKVLIAAGELRDLQGREGVMLPGRIGDEVVRWRAETYLEFQGKQIPYPDLEFELSGDAHLTGLIQNDVPGQPPIVIDPRIEGLIQEAQATLLSMQELLPGLQQSATDADQRATDAEQAASAAAGSASDAAGSATAAANSAASAAGSASDAGAARDAAEAARTGAEAARSGAEDARDAADNHATRAETAADSFDLTATATTGAPGTPAQVTVTGDGPAYGLSFTVPQGEKGDPGPPGEVSQAALDAAVASLVDGAPEALDTLSELADALGNDPNFATTVSTEIGKRALQTDVDTALSGKADTSHSHPVADVTGLQAELDGKVADGDPRLSDARTPTAHTHTVSDLTATGTASSTTYLRGDGSWATPPNTTYSVPTQAEAEAGTATTGRAFSAQRVRQAIDARAVTKQGAAQGLWIGTESTLPTTGTAGVLYVTY